MIKVEIPESIININNKLIALCDKYPIDIPLIEAANFLGMDKEGLRNSIERGGCQFGLCVQKNIHGNRAFKINTFAFYNWLTNGAIFRDIELHRYKANNLDNNIS